jgi:hypothetical protein
MLPSCEITRALRRAHTPSPRRASDPLAVTVSQSTPTSVTLASKLQFDSSVNSFTSFWFYDRESAFRATTLPPYYEPGVLLNGHPCGRLRGHEDSRRIIDSTTLPDATPHTDPHKGMESQGKTIPRGSSRQGTSTLGSFRMARYCFRSA